MISGPRFSQSLFLLIIVLVIFGFTHQNRGNYSIRIARVKYNGGGDWYSSRTALTNLAKFCNNSLQTSIDPNEGIVELSSPDIYNYPYLFLTGHGNIIFNNVEIENLRMYLEAGGFLHICDNYGLDKFIRPQMKRVFPELDFVELPFNHNIYHQKYDFPNGLVKVHQHDGKAPKGYGIIYKGKVVCFYDYECDLGNGWEDAEVHNDPAEIRTKALQMGANIIQYSFNN